MRRILYFKLGTQDEITFRELVQAFKQITAILADLDAAISDDKRGSVKWKVEVLQKASPPLLGLVGEPVRRRNTPPPSPERVTRIESKLITGVSLLSHDVERASYISDSALLRVRNLAIQSRRIGPIQISTDGDSAPIDEATLDSIKKLTGTKTKSEGSITGRLDTIAVHHDNEIRVWDEETSKPVRCRFDSDLEQEVKDALRHRVLVSGLVSYNPFGQPVSVRAESIERIRDQFELPTIEQMSGLLEKPTGDLSLREYLSRIRDDE